jgi:hypothetical protein
MGALTPAKGKLKPSEHWVSSGSDLARAASQIRCRGQATPVVLNRPNRGDYERVIASPQTECFSRLSPGTADPRPYPQDAGSKWS